MDDNLQFSLNLIFLPFPRLFSSFATRNFLFLLIYVLSFELEEKWLYEKSNYIENDKKLLPVKNCLTCFEASECKSAFYMNMKINGNVNLLPNKILYAKNINPTFSQKPLKIYQLQC